MDKKKWMDWAIFIYGILLLIVVLSRIFLPSLYLEMDSRLVFAVMIFGFTILTIIKNRLRGLNKILFIQQILLAVIILISYIAISRYGN